MNRDDVIEAMAKAHTSCGNEFHGRPNHEIWDAWPESGREEAREEMRAVLSALEAMGIALVPVEPTEAMIKAACETIDEAMGGFYPTDVQAITSGYGSMLSASPLRKTEGGEG